MINKLTVVHTNNTNPYHNLALEEYIFRKVKDDEMVLYLWQNKHTVVIGKNQNASVECKINKLKENGGYLTRRLSGGGAVYHDLGNLNFTFITRKNNFDKEKQTEVVLNAARNLGIDCKKNGRNDIVYDDKKFSGHSYYSSGDSAFHNGTLMIDVNKETLSEYLNVSPLKLKSKGVKSVRSRVVNMKEINPEITVMDVCLAMIDACQEVYGIKAGILLDTERFPLGLEDEEQFKEIYGKFISDEWIYGKEIPMEYSCEAKFDWGLVRVDFDLHGEYIARSAIWSDGLDGDAISMVPDVICGKKATRESLIHAIGETLTTDKAEDVAGIIIEEINR